MPPDFPDEPGRQRLNRNWNELLQELRVTQTGVQILTGFLLILPFQEKFADLTDTQRGVYLVTVVLAVAATALLLAPVSHHRTLFRRQRKEWLVLLAGRFAQAGLASLALAVTGVLWLLFDLVVGRPASLIAAASALVAFVALWWAVPVLDRRRQARRQE
ncbi:MAG: sodium:proton antiporter [Propionibacteriales bacterium]|nr:sodium:proton antiporter [Propionibacteriales bacterium]